MSYAPIRKKSVHANMPDYDRARANFSWEDARKHLAGLPGGGLNMAAEALDRHVAEGNGERIALRWLPKEDGRNPVDFTYAALKEKTDRFACYLQAIGLEREERVFALLGRVPQVHITALGTMKAGGVFCPLFSAFGPEPVRTRLELGDARVLVTSRLLYERKVAPIREFLPDLRHILIVDDDGAPPPEGTVPFETALATPGTPRLGTRADDPSLLHFTSGTTGKPKGALHVHEAVLGHVVSGRLVLDVREGDVFWCTADPGWVTGISYGVVAPLACGATVILDESEFDAARWCRILQDQAVNVWYTAPTAIRMLMRLEDAYFRNFDFPHLRHAASVGEPLNPEAVVWGAEVLGRPFHDTWWQTETGAIMIANFAALDIKPGAMGKAVPGVEAAVVHVASDGTVIPRNDGEEGDLALKMPWPSRFRAYIGEEERYRKRFAQGWYLTGDLAKRDSDGYFWFVGRADDVIKSAGHLISPFEVESVLMEHPAVAEAGVIGKPDPTVGETVKAFVALKPGHEPDDVLRRALMGHARKRLGVAIAPREIAFSQDLPKTRSGKIMRRLLKARELGLDEGDTSTLETT